MKKTLRYKSRRRGTDEKPEKKEKRKKVEKVEKVEKGKEAKIVIFNIENWWFGQVAVIQKRSNTHATEFMVRGR